MKPHDSADQTGSIKEEHLYNSDVGLLVSDDVYEEETEEST